MLGVARKKTISAKNATASRSRLTYNNINCAKDGLPVLLAFPSNAKSGSVTETAEGFLDRPHEHRANGSMSEVKSTYPRGHVEGNIKQLCNLAAGPHLDISRRKANHWGALSNMCVTEVVADGSQLVTFRCITSTPFGVPVVPRVHC